MIARPRRVLSLAEVLAGAERASARVARWPQWMRDLSRFKTPGNTITDRVGYEPMKTSTLRRISVLANEAHHAAAIADSSESTARFHPEYPDLKDKAARDRANATAAENELRAALAGVGR